MVRVLAVLPYVGSVIYFLFGEIDLGSHADKRHKEVFDNIRARASHLMGAPDGTDRLIDPLYRPAFRYSGSINGFHRLPEVVPN